MYDSFYNLAEKPFKISTDPRFLWCGEKHKEALANLSYGLMAGNGFVALTGDIGTGKTTLVNALLETLDDRVSVAKINHPSLDTIEFLTLVAKTFDPSVSINGKCDQLLFFNSFLRQIHAQGKVALLIIDEAHRLSVESLEEIRLLSNIEQAGQSLLNIILVGQNELKPMLLSPQCRALRQRITLFYEIQALSQEETIHYVEYRLKVSGVLEHLFTPAALHKIHAYSRGNPRLINILCDRALLTGFVKARNEIDADIIYECACEMNLRDQTKAKLSAVWNQKLPSWKRALITVSVTGVTAVNQILGRAWKWIHESQIAAFAEIGNKIKTVALIAISTTGRFTQKNRRKIITSGLAAGIAATALILTIGAYREAEIKKDPSLAEKKTVVARLSASSAARKPAKKPMALGFAAQMANTRIAASMPGRQGSAIETSVANRMPEAQSPNPVPREAYGQPEPTPAEESAAALEQGDYQKAVRLLEAIQAGKVEENSDTAGLYAKALVGRAGEIIATSPLQAEIMLLKAIQAAPDLADPFLMLGKHYTRTKEYDRAIEAYQKAVRLDPDLSDAFFNLGFIYATSGEFEAAEKAFARVVQLKPPYLDKSLFNLAVVQQKLGKIDESIANLKLVTAMAPGNKKALALLKRLQTSAINNIAKQGM